MGRFKEEWRTILLAALLIISNIMWFAKVESLENLLLARIGQLQGEINNISSSVSSSVNGVLYSLEEQAQNQASIIESFSYDLGEYKENKAELKIRCRLKEYTEGQQLKFILKGDDEPEQSVEAELNEEGYFVAKLYIPLYNELIVSVATELGTTKSYETIDDQIINVKIEYIPALELSSHGVLNMYQAPRGDQAGYFKLGFGVEVIQYGGQKCNLENITVDVIKNGKVVHSAVLVKGSRLEYGNTGAIAEEALTKAELETALQQGEEIPHAYAFDNLSLVAVPGDEVEVSLRTKDNMGNKYSIIAERYIVKQNGDLDDSFMEDEFLRQFDIELAK